MNGECIREADETMGKVSFRPFSFERKGTPAGGEKIINKAELKEVANSRKEKKVNF